MPPAEESMHDWHRSCASSPGACRGPVLNCRESASPPVFFFNDPATSDTSTLSLHDALPISCQSCIVSDSGCRSLNLPPCILLVQARRDRKSTRLNSSHLVISYAVFCLK